MHSSSSSSWCLHRHMVNNSSCGCPQLHTGHTPIFGRTSANNSSNSCNSNSNRGYMDNSSIPDNRGSYSNSINNSCSFNMTCINNSWRGISSNLIYLPTYSLLRTFNFSNSRIAHGYLVSSRINSKNNNGSTSINIHNSCKHTRIR